MATKKKTQRDAVYKLYVDLTQAVKKGFNNVPTEDMLKVLGGYMKLMGPPEEAEEITMSPDEVKQTALLASQALARQLFERLK